MSQKILIVDDEEDIAELIGSLLESEGFEVKTCFDGQEASEAFDQEPYDLVMTDHNMPKMSGFELLKSIKSQNPWTPVLCFFTEGGELNLKDFYHEGCDAYMAKPFKPSEVKDRVFPLVQPWEKWFQQDLVIDGPTLHIESDSFESEQFRLGRNGIHLCGPAHSELMTGSACLVNWKLGANTHEISATLEYTLQTEGRVCAGLHWGRLPPDLLTPLKEFLVAKKIISSIPGRLS